MRKCSEEEADDKKRKNNEKKDNSNYKNNNVITKKAKSGFAKIKNHIESTVKGNKFMQYVKKKTKTIPQFLLTR
jgi:hypothetical protein